MPGQPIQQPKGKVDMSHANVQSHNQPSPSVQPRGTINPSNIQPRGTINPSNMLPRGTINQSNMPPSQSIQSNMPLRQNVRPNSPNPNIQSNNTSPRPTVHLNNPNNIRPSVRTPPPQPNNNIRKNIIQQQQQTGTNKNNKTGVIGSNKKNLKNEPKKKNCIKMFCKKPWSEKKKFLKNKYKKICPGKSKVKPKLDPKIKKIQSYEIIDTFKYFYYIIWFFCRLPFYYKINEDGGYKFILDKKDIRYKLFKGFNIALTGILILASLNLLSILLNFPSQRKQVDGYGFNGSNFKTDTQLRAEELFILYRNVIPIIFIFMELIQAVGSGWNIYVSREMASSFLTLWSEASEILQISPVFGVKKHMHKLIGFHMIVWTMLLILSMTGIVPVTTSYPSMFAVLMFRGFVPHIYSFEHIWTLRILAWVTLTFIISSAKIYVFMFHMHCKMLKNVQKAWNHRLDRVLHRGEGGHHNWVKAINRTGYDHLFKDHICLLDLFQGTDELYGNIVMMFYGTQISGLCLLMYYFLQSQSATDFDFGLRRLDGVAIFIYIIYTICVIYQITIAAAHVGEEAAHGLEVVRSKGMLGEKIDQELHFMLSMYVSYSGFPETALSAGRYFVLDKSFMVTLVSVIFGYFVVLIQFTPQLSFDSSIAYKGILTDDVIKKLLLTFEQTADIHFIGNRTLADLLA